MCCGCQGYFCELVISNTVCEQCTKSSSNNVRLKGRLRKVFLNGIPGTGIRIPLAFRHLPRSIFVVQLRS